MRHWWSLVLLVVLVARVVWTAPAGKELHQKPKDGMSMQKMGLKDHSGSNQMIQTGQKQNKMTGDNEFKFASSSMNNGDQMKHLSSRQKVKSPRDNPMMHQTSKQLHLQSDKATEDKLMKMLNNEKDPKLVFPKSGGDRGNFGDHYDLLEENENMRKPQKFNRRNKYGDHEDDINKYHRNHIDEEEHSARPTKGHFNVFKLKEAKRSRHDRDIHPREFEKGHKENFRSRHIHPTMNDRIDRDETPRMRKPRRHHKPEDHASYDRDDRRHGSKRRHVDDEDKEQHYQAEIDKEQTSALGEHHGPKDFLGKQELFQKSYSPMDYSAQDRQGMSPKFHQGMSDRPFMGMGKSGLGYSRGMLGSGSSEDFSPDY